MGRKPKVKTCADPSCPLTFTGRGLYCDGHKDRKFTLGGSPTTGVSSPLHQSDASPQVRGLQAAGQNGHVRRGPDPIDVVGTPGMTVTDAIDDFMAAWGCDMR